MENRGIGIDFGHCETSASCTYQNESGVWNVARLDTAGGNKQVIPTQIILTDEQMEKLRGKTELSHKFLDSIGPFRIGDCPEYVPDGERFIYFKAPPKDFNKPCGLKPKSKECGITHRMLTACYIHALLENIFLYNENVIPKEKDCNINLYIGCPATQDWTSEIAMKTYSALASSASGFKNVRIIPESRAAMFSREEMGLSNVSAMDGALVFDFGSSTADCTYMLLGRKIMEFSWALGASEIERLMMKEALDKAQSEYGAFETTEESLINVTNYLRSIKEAYFNGNTKSKGEKIICSFDRNNEEDPVECMLNVDGRLMNDIIRQRKISIYCDSTNYKTDSWENLCRSFFREAKKRIKALRYRHPGRIKKRCRVAAVVITGGASKMGFIESICKSEFCNSGITVYANHNNPSHTVSYGLGWISVVDQIRDECRSRILKVFTDNNGLMNKYSKKVSKTAFRVFRRVLKKEAKKWSYKPDEGSDSVNGLIEQLRIAVDNAETVDVINRKCRRWFGKWKRKNKKNIALVILENITRLYPAEIDKSLILPKKILKDVQTHVADTSSINCSNIVRDLNFSHPMKKVFGPLGILFIWVLAILLTIPTLGFIIPWARGKLHDIKMSMEDYNVEIRRTKGERMRIASHIINRIKRNRSFIMKNFDDKLYSHNSCVMSAMENLIDTSLSVVTLQLFEL